MAVENWKIEDIGDLKGQNVIVTGGNSGIGLETVLVLASKGANVILASRSKERADEALKGKSMENISIEILDLASLESIKTFSDNVHKKIQKLDILIDNAGIMAIPELKRTKDGFESQFGTNHLGHFALTGHLLDLLKKSEAPRVVVVSSLAHRRCEKFEFDNLQGEKEYNLWYQYALSKTCNIYFVKHFQKLASQSQSLAKLKVIAVHPGVSLTNLATNLTWYYKIFMILYLPWLQKADKGAMPTLYAAVAPEAEAGQYYGPNSENERSGNSVKVAFVTDLAKNEENAAKLWTVSEELTKVKYEF